MGDLKWLTLPFPKEKSNVYVEQYAYNSINHCQF